MIIYKLQFSGSNTWLYEYSAKDGLVAQDMLPGVKVATYAGPQKDRMQISKGEGDDNKIILDVPMSLCIIDNGIDDHVV